MRRLELRCACVGGPRAGGRHDARAQHERTELFRRELAGPRQQHQPLEHGVDMHERVARQDIAGVLVALAVVDDGQQRGARPATGVEEVIERGEPGLLRKRSVRRPVDHGRSIAMAAAFTVARSGPRL